MTWAVLDVAVEDPAEEEEPVGAADLPDRLVSADLIRWVGSSVGSDLNCVGL